MATYKHKKTGEAVRAVIAYYEKAAELLTHLDEAKKKYSKETYARIEAAAQEEFLPYYSAAKMAIDEAVAAMDERATQRLDEMMSDENVQSAYNLLNSPVTLKEYELRRLMERNQSNTMLIRAIGEYAEKKGYSGFSGLKDIGDSAYHSMMEAGKKFRHQMTDKVPSDKLLSMRNHTWQANAVKEYDARELFAEW